MDWLSHLHNDHGEVAALVALLSSPVAVMEWLRSKWGMALSARIWLFRWMWREARCNHQGCREWTTFDYHETIGAEAMKCDRCGLYWDATQGARPRSLGFVASLRRCLPVLLHRNRTPRAPKPKESDLPF